ncbi:MAG TPA: NYN domain-containing protein [Egibacteraceae bacterium]|nr:NYN domain-containing protein [Egibacteraceae bacterium]
MTAEEERIALFIDYENLAIGARDEGGRAPFDLRPIADALAERGRVVVRRAYADWSYFGDDRRMLTEQHVELIEIPQRMGAVRKNAADIKMAVDAIELSFEREYITTFVICTGDSDFTPLVAKLRSLNKRVIGVGMQASTSALLPPACDEFLFYERLEGVPQRKPQARGPSARRPRPERPRRGEEEAPEALEAPPAAPGEDDEAAFGKLLTQTLSGLQRSSGGAVLASTLKRALLRKDPTFNEADYGYRAFGELLRHLEDRKVIELSSGPSRGDPEVSFPEDSSGEERAFGLLRAVVAELQRSDGPPPLSGLKNQLRKREPTFSEKEFGFSGFLQFCKAARARGLVRMEWDDQADDYILDVPEDQ